MESETNEQRPGIASTIVMLLIPLIIGMLFLGSFYGWGCKFEAIGKDKYCKDMSNGYGFPEWKVGSHEEDRINAEKREEEKIIWREKYDKKIACYNEGYNYSESFDIFEDYNLTCRKIAYLNDHLMDNFGKKDGGYIRGSFRGFLSSGHVEGKSYEYINDRVVATGKLIEKIEYHVDCENSTNKFTLVSDYHRGWYFDSEDTTKIDYFTEEEFVMAYVDECLY